MVFAYDLLNRPGSVLATYDRGAAAGWVDSAYDSGIETETDGPVEVAASDDLETALAARNLVDTLGTGDSDE